MGVGVGVGVVVVVGVDWVVVGVLVACLRVWWRGLGGVAVSGVCFCFVRFGFRLLTLINYLH